MTQVRKISEFRELLMIAAEMQVKRQLVESEIPVRLHNDDQVISAVEMTNGAILVCVTTCSFYGTDVTPPDPIDVNFYIIE